MSTESHPDRAQDTRGVVAPESSAEHTKVEPVPVSPVRAATVQLNHDQLMSQAMAEAQLAPDHHDVPVGALVVSPTGEIIAARHNERELLSDPTAHAEILALRDAAQRVGSWRLSGCTLVVTLEPCVMCAGAAHSSRIDAVVFGAYDLRGGALGSLYNVGTDARLNHEFTVVGGVRVDETAELLTTFFAARR